MNSMKKNDYRSSPASYKIRPELNTTIWIYGFMKISTCITDNSRAPRAFVKKGNPHLYSMLQEPYKIFQEVFLDSEICWDIWLSNQTIGSQKWQKHSFRNNLNNSLLRPIWECMVLLKHAFLKILKKITFRGWKKSILREIISRWPKIDFQFMTNWIPV